MRSVDRFASVVRTAVKRRGLGYTSHLWKEHAIPRATYAALLGPSRLHAASRAAETVFTVGDLARTDAVLRQALALHRRHGDAPSGSAVSGARARMDDFAHEWLALELLYDSGVTPRVLSADERSRTLQLSMFDHPGGTGTPQEVEFQRALNLLHRHGVVGVRYALDQVRISSEGEVRFAALPGVRVLRRRGVRFQVERDRDRASANERFGLALLTEAGVREGLRRVREQLPAGWFQQYAPIDFGGGVSVGRFAMTDSGTGRWDVFNRDVVAPLVRGARVLDLGSNNGSLPLMMLRAGASEVLAVERSPLLADAARINARVFEWRDMRQYNLRIHVGDMRDVLHQDWGRFDVVTAFCSLYYLPEEDMSAIIRHAAEMGATLVLQSNEGAENIPASRAARLKELTQQNGYADVRVHAFGEFARPIVVGVPVPVAQPALA
ncbi:MAG: class I SAM-dependent methyltransferase [Acidobacteriota bacterium]